MLDDIVSDSGNRSQTHSQCQSAGPGSLRAVFRAGAAAQLGWQCGPLRHQQRCSRPQQLATTQPAANLEYPLSRCLQTTASLCLPAQQLVSLQLSVHPLAACCLPWRKPAASGAGKHSVDVTSKQQLGLFMCRLVRAAKLSFLPHHMHTATAHSRANHCLCLFAGAQAGAASWLLYVRPLRCPS